MLILAELARYELSAPRRRLPVDPRRADPRAHRHAAGEAPSRPQHAPRPQTPADGHAGGCASAATVPARRRSRVATGSVTRPPGKPSGPRSRAGKAGQRCGPKRTGISVNGSRVLAPPATATTRVAGNGSNPCGHHAARYSILNAARRSHWKCECRGLLAPKESARGRVNVGADHQAADEKPLAGKTEQQQSGRPAPQPASAGSLTRCRRSPTPRSATIRK